MYRLHVLKRFFNKMIVRKSFSNNKRRTQFTLVQLREITQVIFILVRLKSRDYIQLLGNNQVSTITNQVTSILSYQATSGSYKYSFIHSHFWLTQVFFYTQPLLAYTSILLYTASSGLHQFTKKRFYRFG